MGQSSSSEYDYNSQELPWHSLFSPKIIAFIKKELDHQHPQAESTEGQTVDFVPLSQYLKISFQLKDLMVKHFACHQIFQIHFSDRSFEILMFILIKFEIFQNTSSQYDL